VTPFDRLGRFVVRRAWWVVAAWAALLLVAIPFAPQVPGRLSAGGFILDDLESARAKSLLETELGAPPSALVIVFSSPTLTAGMPDFEVAAADEGAGLESLQITVDGKPAGGESLAAADMKRYLEGFDLKLIVEKVEDESTLAKLLDYGVELAQGHVFGKPQPMSPALSRELEDADAA